MRWLRDSARPLIVLGTLAIGAFAFNTVENLPIGILPDLVNSFRVSSAVAGLSMSVYAASMVVGSIPLTMAARRLRPLPLLLLLFLALMAASLVSARTSSFEIFIAARVATALAHGVFWSVMGPIALTHFQERDRGRVLAVLAFGGASAAVAGVPAATALAATANWRLSLSILAFLSALLAVVLSVTISNRVPQEEKLRRRGSNPQPLRFAAVLATLGLSVIGTFIALTYLTLLDVAAEPLSGDTAAAGLLVFGLSGMVSVAVIGKFVDRKPSTCLTLALTAQFAGLVLLLTSDALAFFWLGMGLLGGGGIPVGFICMHISMDCTPVGRDFSMAVLSTIFNIGVAAGGLIGGLVVDRFSVGDALVVASGFTVFATLTAMAASGLRALNAAEQQP